MADSQLYYGDNLDILRRYLKDETVDLRTPPMAPKPRHNIVYASAELTPLALGAPPQSATMAGRSRMPGLNA